MTEVWVSIEGFSYYEVSSLGRVRSLDKIVRRSHGSWGVFRGRILKVGRTNTYHHVSLMRDGCKVIKTVHRLVAEHFCPGKALGLEVNHRNLNKSDNRASNLEWVQHRQNLQHAAINGVLGRKDHRRAKLAPQSVCIGDVNPNKGATALHQKS